MDVMNVTGSARPAPFSVPADRKQQQQQQQFQVKLEEPSGVRKGRADKGFIPLSNPKDEGDT